MTTIKARGLSLPSPGVPRADYDQAERLGVATLKLIAAYAMRLISGDRSVHKVVLFDEAWFLLASRDGRRLIDRLNRLGRAENATLILATQQLADVGEIENLIGTRLIFGQETIAEARRALELLGLDPDDRALVERVRGYRKGRCLMRDITDQVAEVQIDPIPPHLLEVLDTTPDAATAPRWSHDPPPAPHAHRAARARRRRHGPARWLGAEVAGAKYRGSDVLGNLSPESLLGDGSLVDRYPLSAYALDFHVDVGVSELSGVPPTIAHWAAAQLWSLSSFLVRTVIDVFTWAFSLDLLGGSPDQAGDGAIGPVADAISSLYENVIGEAWMVAAITLAGIWGIWKGLVQRRYSQTAASLAVSVCFVLVALFFVYQPERTDRAGQPMGQPALARVPVRREPRHRRRPGRRQAQGRRPALRRAGPAAVAGAELRRPKPLRRHRPARRRRLPSPGLARTTPPRDVCRDHLRARQGRARRLRPAVPAPRRPAQTSATPSTKRSRTARRPRATTSSAATRSTRPTPRRSTSSRPAAPTNASRSPP